MIHIHLIPAPFPVLLRRSTGGRQDEEAQSSLHHLSLPLSLPLPENGLSPHTGPCYPNAACSFRLQSLERVYCRRCCEQRLSPSSAYTHHLHLQSVIATNNTLPLLDKGDVLSLLFGFPLHCFLLFTIYTRLNSEHAVTSASLAQRKAIQVPARFLLRLLLPPCLNRLRQRRLQKGGIRFSVSSRNRAVVVCL